MHQLRGLLYLTFRELWAKKIIVGLFIVSTLAWVVLMLFMNVEEVEGGISMLRLFGGEVATSGAPPGGAPPAPADTAAADTIASAADSAAVDAEMRRNRPPSNRGAGIAMSFQQFTVLAETVVAQAAYWIVIVLGIFSAAPLFSRLLESGHVELLLSKPMSRVRLLAGHVLGVVLMVSVLAAYLFGAVWLVLSIKIGVWNAKFLLSIFVLVGMFAVLYAVVAFVTIWTESTALALIATYGIIFISLFLSAQGPIYEALGPVGDAAFGTLYYLVPNFAEVGIVAAQLLHGDAVTRWAAVGSTAAAGALLYLGTGFWFTRRDF